MWVWRRYVGMFVDVTGSACRTVLFSPIALLPWFARNFEQSSAPPQSTHIPPSLFAPCSSPPPAKCPQRSADQRSSSWRGGRGGNTHHPGRGGRAALLEPPSRGWKPEGDGPRPGALLEWGSRGVLLVAPFIIAFVLGTGVF